MQDVFWRAVSHRFGIERVISFVSILKNEMYIVDSPFLIPLCIIFLYHLYFWERVTGFQMALTTPFLFVHS